MQPTDENFCRLRTGLASPAPSARTVDALNVQQVTEPSTVTIIHRIFFLNICSFYKQEINGNALNRELPVEIIKNRLQS